MEGSLPTAECQAEAWCAAGHAQEPKTTTEGQQSAGRLHPHTSAALPKHPIHRLPPAPTCGLSATLTTGASAVALAWGGRNTKVQSQVLASHTRTVASAPAVMTWRAGNRRGCRVSGQRLVVT